MAQYAPVAPIQILEAMKEDKLLGTYHLLLTHHILEYPDRFRELFADQKKCTIIVDNSVVELGDAASDEKVLEACNILKSGTADNWIIPVLTDVMGDGAATREATTESYEWWEDHAPEYPLMAVCQGETWEEYVRTVDHFFLSELYPNIAYAGIPRILVKQLGTRQLALQYFDAVAPSTAVHLLGFSDDVTDDIICSNMRHIVEGIDSAVPLRYAHSFPDSPLYTPSCDIPPRPADWFEKGEFSQDDVKNLFNIRKWVA